MNILDRFFHRHVYELLKEIQTCERHEVWHVCNCGKIVHQVIREEIVHEFGPYTYAPGTNTTSFRGVDFFKEACEIKTRYCIKCGYKELTKA